MMRIFSTYTYAQSTKKETPTPTTQPIKKEVVKPIAAKKAALVIIEESFKFLGNQLLFQVKERLNLTMEEEEKKQSKSNSNKKFSFFGIEVERD